MTPSLLRLALPATVAALLFQTACGPPAEPRADPSAAKGRTVTVVRAWRWGHAETDAVVALRVQAIYRVEAASMIQAGPAEVPSYTLSVETEGGQWVRLKGGVEEVLEEAYSTRVGKTVKTTGLALGDLLPRRGDIAPPQGEPARAAMVGNDDPPVFTGEGFLVRCPGGEGARETLARPECQGCDRMTPEPSEHLNCGG